MYQVLYQSTTALLFLDLIESTVEVLAFPPAQTPIR